MPRFMQQSGGLGTFTAHRHTINTIGMNERIFPPLLFRRLFRERQSDYFDGLSHGGAGRPHESARFKGAV